MYAIVEIAGLQYRVEQDQKLFVNRLKAAEGSKVSFERVLLTANGGTVTVGAPVIAGLSVEAKVIKHLKGDKVIIFKKKRRKSYQKSNGHRQALSQIQIVSLGGSGATTTKKEPKKAVIATDDLTKVEGIGPKVVDLFAENGIVTFADLSGQTTEKLKEILAEKGGRYAGMNPDTWPEQATLAAAGKWEKLKKWQDELNGGV